MEPLLSDSLFEHASIPIWVEDFSDVRAHFDMLKENGVNDWDEHFDNNPGDVINCCNLIRVVDVNAESLRFFKSSSKEEIIRHLPKYFCEESWPAFRKEMVALAQGADRFETEIPVLDLNGNKQHLLLRLSVIPEYRTSLGRVMVSFIDITKRKNAEEALLRKEFWLIETQRIGKVGSYEMNVEEGSWKSTIVLDELFGIEDSYIKTMGGWNNLIHPDDRARMMHYFHDQVIDRHLPFDMDYKILRPGDKTVRWVHGRGDLVLNAQGRVSAMIGTIQDITDRKHAEELLLIQQKLGTTLSSTAEMPEAVNQLLDAICKAPGIDCGGVYLMNKTDGSVDLAGHRGLRPDFIENNLHFEASQPNAITMKNGSAVFYDQRNIDGRLGADMQKEGLQSAGIVPVKHGDEVIGSINAGSHTVPEIRRQTRIFLETLANQIGGTLVRLNAEKNTHERQQEYKTMLQTSMDGFIVLDSDLRFVDVNDAFCRIVGFTKSELLSMDFSDFEPPSPPVTMAQRSGKVMMSGSDRFETVIICKDQSNLDVEISMVFFPVKGGRYYIFLHDITERKKAAEKLEETSRLKTSLLLNFSHELRTPLNGIIGFSELLMDQLDAPEYKKMASSINISGNRLMDTLDAIMDLAQIESDRTTMVLEDLNLSEETARISGDFNLLARKKNLEFQATITHDAYSRADRKLFSTLLTHLLGNAFKFTKHGKVVLTLHKEITDKDRWIVILVTDTGIGIPESMMGRIFEPFRQISEGIGRTHEGTGLGLTLCKKFVELMGGSITVRSTQGMGSTFRVRLPLSDAPGANAEAANQFPPDDIRQQLDLFTEKQYKILIVEDNEFILDLMGIYLKPYFNVSRAQDSQAALTIASSEPFDLILMDVNLGAEMDGLKIAHKVRADGVNKSIPIIAVTGYTTLAEKEHILTHGCTHFLPKPFNQQTLLKKVKEALMLQV
jgi:PAS domain S-box-containing protein